MGDGTQLPEAERPTALDLDASLLVRPVASPPRKGWRRAVFRATGGLLTIADSAREQRRRELVERVRTPSHGCSRIALLSLKGGVGKTTTTVTLGSTFAALRGDRVVAVDANPDRGTLSQKIACETTATVRTLLRDEQRLVTYADVREYMSQNPHRLEVLASDADPAVSEAFSGEDYERTLAVLERFYSIVLTDCGTGLMHSAMRSILGNADTLIVISSGSVDGAQSASATLDWLEAHGYRDLVAGSVAVVNAVRPRSGKVDIDRLVGHFALRCRAVHVLPFDPHLEEGADIDLGRLQDGTRRALLELAADVAAGFASSGPRVGPGGSS